MIPRPPDLVCKTLSCGTKLILDDNGNLKVANAKVAKNAKGHYVKTCDSSCNCVPVVMSRVTK